MKLIILLAVMLNISASAQLSVQIIGNNACRFPYNDNEPITLRITGLTEGQWYEITFPTNHIEGHTKPEITREVALYFQLNNNIVQINTQSSSILNPTTSLSYDGQTMDYVFNGPASAYSNFTTLIQWHQGHPEWYLAPGANARQYHLSVRPLNSDKPVVAYFRIIP